MACPTMSSSSRITFYVNSAALLSSHYGQERSHLSSFISMTSQSFIYPSGRSSRWSGIPCRASMELGPALSSSSLVSESPCSSTSGITWAQSALQGSRPEMEDSIVIRSDGLQGFSYAAVLDGHAGFSSVEFLREELFKECAAATENGLLLHNHKTDLSSIQSALTKAFLQADNRLLSWLEGVTEGQESGSTATVMFLGANCLIVAHVGDSRVVIARGRNADIIGSNHRPYGKSKTALAEIKRIRQAGGWINNGRVCGILSVSRAFGDIKLKTLRQEMLEEGVKRGIWTNKFASRIEFNGDWVTAAPDVFQIALEDADFIILASDGLWDYIGSTEAVQFVRKQLREHGNVQRACEGLAKLALDKNGQDNVSVVIADFGKVKYDPNSPSEDSNFSEDAGQAVLILGLVGFGIWLSQFASHSWPF
ncbi:hypothetical protein KP509_22G079500 [Ceratopteris richardii]|uniref:PPM-type phosphatase domain-containing protein n=1 Tax=Ceratopteris richardii TaxID=49495 RepID=A0A8T2S7U1_CERRI|nr:hypothetical protein KP509_22G079500 [Ceratopteris richardii]KAH7307829.1 hypothetical protein KP509_22G079500 [Ceratopteris richardii]